MSNQHTMSNAMGLGTRASSRFDKQCSRDLQLFVLWAATKSSDIKVFTDTITQRFIIKHASKCQWGDEFWGENLTRLYGLLPVGPTAKLREIGGKPFLVAICEDIQPVYGPYQALGGNIELSNLNAMECKRYLREQFGGNYCHCSSNPQEYLRQSTLLFGPTIHSSLSDAPWDGNILTNNRDLMGANGWQNTTDFFNTLNYCCNYIVLRNFQNLPHQLHLEKDIDVLAEDMELFATVANADSTGNGFGSYVTKIDGRHVRLDIRCIGDGYYDALWEKDMLLSKVWSSEAIPTPDPVHHFFSLLYHAKLHKPKIKDQYKPLLVKLAEQINYIGFSEEHIVSHEKAAAILSGFMKTHHYRLTTPLDDRVILNRPVASKITGYSIPRPDVMRRRKILNKLRARLPQWSYRVVPQSIKIAVKRCFDK